MQAVGLTDRVTHGGHVLCLGAHSDDIELGCAGLIGKLVSARPDLSIDWVVFSATGVREDEAKSSAESLLSGVQTKRIHINRFRNGFFPYVGAEIKEYFESLKKLPAPDLILTHYRADLHQDHRVISELTWNTFRNHLVLEYEIPKYDGDLGQPNVFVPLSEGQVKDKIELVERHFQTQRDKQWFSPATFLGLCRLRGVECCSPTGYAEAFYARKLVLA